MKFKYFYYLIILMLLNACMAKYETYYVYDMGDSQNIERCIQYCQITKDRCLKICPNNKSLCKKDLNFSANMDDKDYLNSNTVNPLVFDPVQCVEMSCDCERDYRACYKMCGGTVKTKKRCIANCPDT